MPACGRHISARVLTARKLLFVRNRGALEHGCRKGEALKYDILLFTYLVEKQGSCGAWKIIVWSVSVEKENYFPDLIS